MAILITEKGVRLLAPKMNNRPFGMNELKELLGGPPEVVSLVTTKDRSMCLVINSEARVPVILDASGNRALGTLKYNMNPFATEIYHMFFNTKQFIIGPALLCRVPEEMD